MLQHLEDFKESKSFDDFSIPRVAWRRRDTLETTLDTRRYQQVLVYDAAVETVGIDIDSDAI